MRVIENPDKEHVGVIRAALEKNGGYCPCSLIKSDDTKCICKKFKEQETPGKCHCGLYIKVEAEDKE